MGKDAKRIVSVIIVLILIVGAFVVGNSADFNILSALGFPSKTRSHIAETIPDTEPHTAEEVVEVESVVPFDEEGYGTIEIVQQKVPYVVEVDFTPVLLDEAQFEKKLIIMTQRASAAEIANKPGLWNIPVFKQTKAIIFHGEGTFSIDMSSLSSSDFVIDNDKKTITIFIPKPQLSVKLLPNETEFFDSSNGVLRFGEMQITPEAMTTLESEGIAKITETLEADTNTWETARKFAKLSVKEIYEPLVMAQVNAAVQNADDEFAIPAYYTISVEIRG